MTRPRPRLQQHFKGVLCVLVTVVVLGFTPSAWAAEPNVAYGTKHALGLRNNGDVLTWGDNVMCQLGRETTGNPNAFLLAVGHLEIGQFGVRRRVAAFLGRDASRPSKAASCGRTPRGSSLGPAIRRFVGISSGPATKRLVSTTRWP